MATVEITYSMDNLPDRPVARLKHIKTDTIDTTASSPANRSDVPEGAQIAAIYCPSDVRIMPDADASSTSERFVTGKQHVNLSDVKFISAIDA